MCRDEQRLDSCQNLICSPTENDSVETGDPRMEHVSHVGGYMETANIYVEGSIRWHSEEDAERLASDLDADPGEHERRRKSRALTCTTTPAVYRKP